MAFDPIGPPPKKTIEWTTNYIYWAVVPKIDFEDISVQEALDFISQATGIPSAYRVEVDATAMGKTILKSKIQMQEKNIKLSDAIAKIADRINAKMVIDEGVIRLVPK